MTQRRSPTREMFPQIKGPTHHSAMIAQFGVARPGKTRRDRLPRDKR